VAKFDEKAWRERNEREQEEEEARKFLEYQGSDAELRAELTDMLGASYDDIVKAWPQDSGERKAMDKARRKAQRKLKQGDARGAEKIVMGTRGMKEVRKKAKSSKSCLVVGAMILSSVSLSVWGMVEGARALLG
jgi:hypothetical protein